MDYDSYTDLYDQMLKLKPEELAHKAAEGHEKIADLESRNRLLEQNALADETRINDLSDQIHRTRTGLQSVLWFVNSTKEIRQELKTTLRALLEEASRQSDGYDIPF